MSTAQEQMLVDVARQAEVMRIADVNLAQAGDAKSVPHARRFARFLEGAGKSTAWCVALLQFDGVLDAEELNAVAAGTRLAANAKAKAAVEKWLEKGLRCAAAETELRMAAPTTAGSTLPLAAMLSQLQTPQGPQGLGALKLTLGGNVDNGSLRAFQHERQTSSGKEQAEDDDEEGGRSTRAVRLRRDIVGANTLPLGRRQRKDFVKEVILGPQVERICREFFGHVGPSRLQYKSVADQGDETIFLEAIPQPKVSQAQAEAWQLGGHWRKPSKVSQVGREGAIDAGRQKEIDELWARQKLLRERLEKIDLPLAELTRQLADSTQPGTNADETWSMWQEVLRRDGDSNLGAAELVHRLTTQVHSRCVAVSERACMSAFYSLLADSVLQDKKFLLSQVHSDSLMQAAYAVEKDYTGYEKKLNKGFDAAALSADAHTRRLFEQGAAKMPRYDHAPSPDGRGRDRRGHNAGGDRAGRGYWSERDGRSDGRGNGGASQSGRLEQDFDCDADIPEDEDLDVDEDHDEDFDEDEDADEDWEETAQHGGGDLQCAE
mgnify:FL=1